MELTYPYISIYLSVSIVKTIFITTESIRSLSDLNILIDSSTLWPQHRFPSVNGDNSSFGVGIYTDQKPQVLGPSVDVCHSCHDDGCCTYSVHFLRQPGPSIEQASYWLPQPTASLLWDCYLCLRRY